MKSIFGYILAAMLLVGSVACSVVNDAIKSGDPQYAYEQALSLYEDEKWDQASTLFEACRHIYMGTPREDSLSSYNARCKFKQHYWSDASMLLDDYRRKFTRSPFIEEAEGMYALCYYYMSPAPERDQTMTSQAIIAITEFISRYPASDRVESFKTINEELTERLHEKTYLNAYTYYKIGRYKSAIVALKNALRYFPAKHHQMLAKECLEELKQYEFWLAWYSDLMRYPYQVRMWQYTDSGRVPGIDTNVDLNVYMTE